jgi:hypothetical protein
MKNVRFVIILVSIFACSSPKTEVPKLSLNEVLACGHLVALQSKFGAQNIIQDTSWVIGADTLRGSILFPNTPKQVYVYYRAGEIVDVTIKGKSSDWKTDSGLYLGLSLQEVQKLNDRNFTISGFNWAHGGEVVSWEGGKLAGIHLATFSNTGNAHAGLPDSEYAHISGQTEFDVRHESIQKLNPSLDMISLIKPFIPNQAEGKSIGKRISANQVLPAK